MPLTEADKDRLRRALARLAPQVPGEDASQQRQRLDAVFAEAGVYPTRAEWAEFAREETAAKRRGRMASSRVSRAIDAIVGEVRRAGLDTPRDLMARRGLATLPELLTSLGFTGDVAGLAREIEQAAARGPDIPSHGDHTAEGRAT